MEKEFATYEISLKLKEIGFNEKCMKYFSTNKIQHFCMENIFENTNQALYEEYRGNSEVCSIPLWQQAIEWFREEYGIHFEFSLHIDMDRTYYNTCNITREMSFNKKGNPTLNYSDYKDGRWRVVKKIDEIEYPMMGNTYQEAREQAILKAIELIKDIK